MRELRHRGLNNLPKVIELVGGRAETETQISSELKDCAPTHCMVQTPLGRDHVSVYASGPTWICGEYWALTFAASEMGKTTYGIYLNSLLCLTWVTVFYIVDFH